MSAVPPGPRLDRFFPLADAVSYPGVPFADMVFFLPPPAPGGGSTLRLWLRTDAAAPEVEINRGSFRPVGSSARDGSWIDFGVVEHSAEHLGSRGFGILRVYGLTADQLREAWFVVTPQTAVELEGGIGDAERLLGGIARADVGTTTITPSRVRVGSPATFRLTYTAAERGLPLGSRLRLAFPKAFSEPQAERPGDPGWLAVASSDAAVEMLAVSTSIESHERIDALFALPEGLAAGGNIRFEYRTDFTYLFPMRWCTMDRRYWYSHLPLMSLAVAVDARDVFTPPLERNGHTVEFVAGPPERLFLFLPGRVTEGREPALSGTFTDRYRNPPQRGPYPADIVLTLRGERAVDLGSPGQHLTAWYRFSMPLPELAPGVYRAEARDPRSGDLLALSNPMEIMPAGSTAPSVVWGEIHGHCEQSDGSGAFADMFTHAREDARLDFAASADHACYFSDNEWLWMQDVANSRNEQGRFVTLIGYEWAGRQGHRNVYTWRDRLDLFRGMHPGTERLDAVYDHFHGREDIVAGPHTGHTQDFFAFHDPDVQRFLEIYSMWGTFEELASDALNRGARIGFTGGGDCHEGRCGFSVEDPEGQGTTPHTFAPGLRYRCGLTAACLPELSRQALVEALRERRTYATTGARILLDFAVSGVPMGGEGRVATQPSVRVSVHACAPLARVDVVRDGRVVHTASRTDLHLDLQWEDAGAAGGQHWYVAKAVQQDGQTAWTSPVWITVG